MKGNEQAMFIVVAIVLLIFGVFMSFAAPCGCYAGTSIKDVPARCTDIGSPTRQ